MYVLDTDHCIELLRGNDGILSKLESPGEDIEIEVYTTTITAAELFYGAYRMPNPEQRINDLFIASIALSRNLTLVTHNTHHYERILNLCLEDWME